MNDNRIAQLLEIARETMTEAQFCFLITQTATGASQARLMQPFAPEADLAVWFGASPTSRKAEAIRQDNRVTLAYGLASQGAYVTLQGTAVLVTDPTQQEKYWRESFRPFWPEGPTGDNYALIHFVPEHIELMHIEKRVAPEPFGLKPVTLMRGAAGWESTTASG